MGDVDLVGRRRRATEASTPLDHWDQWRAEDATAATEPIEAQVTGPAAVDVASSCEPASEAPDPEALHAAPLAAAAGDTDDLVQIDLDAHPDWSTAELEVVPSDEDVFERFWSEAIGAPRLRGRLRRWRSGWPRGRPRALRRPEPGDIATPLSRSEPS